MPTRTPRAPGVPVGYRDEVKHAAWIIGCWMGLGWGTLAWAAVLQAPEGGRAFLAVKQGVICGPLSGGWSLEADRRTVRPPAQGANDAPAGRAVAIRLAADPDGCARASETSTLVTTGALPEIDPAGVTFMPDEGRLEIKGQRLKGLQVQWPLGGEGKVGQEVCLDPATTGKNQTCVLPITPHLPSDVPLRWAPAGGRFGADVTTVNASGEYLDPAAFLLRPARIVLTSLFPAGAAVDVSQGSGRLPLLHGEAVGSIDCGSARCELEGGALVVRSYPALATSVTARARLAPRVVMQHGDALDGVVTATLSLLHCPLTIVSGPLLRDADQTQTVMRVDQRCGRELRLRWLINGEVAEIVRTVRSSDASYVQLQAGRVSNDRVTITAARLDGEATIIGSVSAATIPVPRPRVSLELPGHGKIDFIPTNRPAVLTLASLGERARLVPIPVEGAYSVRVANGQTLIQGDENAGGFVSLRFAYRVDTLPPEVKETDLATISERVQREVRSASVPATLGPVDKGPPGLIEFLCADKVGFPRPLTPGKPERIPFPARDTCRVVIHQERIKPEDGLQEIALDVDVTRSDGTPRGDAKISERMTLRPASESRVIYLHGAIGQFDRILVRAAHVVDESRYALSASGHAALPSVQWSVTVEGGHLRVYATVTIPAGLYRVNQPVGQLTLNFGVLSRITTLDRTGREGLVGLELGLMGMGLITTPGAIDNYPRTIAAVGGIGLRVPIGDGAAASVNVHLWGAYEFRPDFQYYPDPTQMDIKRTASHWTLIFGPSISIGNVGTNF